MINISEEFRKIIIKTGIDRLMDIVVDRGEITVAEASRMLQIPSSRIEEWGTILSKENMIEVKYESSGDVVLSIAKKNLKSQKNKINKLSEGISTDIGKIDKELKNYEQSLSLNKENINSFEKILNKDISKIENIEKDLSEFSAKKKDLEESIVRIKKEEDILKKEEEELDKKEKDISEKEVQIQGTSKDIINIITEKLKTISESHEKIVSLERDKNRLKEDLELIKKISKIIDKEEDMGKLHEMITDVEDRHKKLKDNSFLLKMKFERFHEIVKKIF